jgi:hypothetical protein
MLTSFSVADVQNMPEQAAAGAPGGDPPRRPRREYMLFMQFACGTQLTRSQPALFLLKPHANARQQPSSRAAVASAG